ncbi:MAG: hypothetical protein QNL04_06775 [SAR324 cluster bacterium]|nr:hypothetical protein [SAR324 cluster bacterium]
MEEQHKKILARIQPIEEFKVDTLDEMDHIVFAAFLLASIDDYIDDLETDEIHKFAKNHWNPDFGDMPNFLKAVDKKLSDFLFPEYDFAPTFDQHVGKFMEIARDVLRPELQLGLLYLMKLVMEADEIFEPREVLLLTSYAEILEI